MSVAKKTPYMQRAIVKTLVMVFGDRALLQTGYPGLIAKWFGCPQARVRPNPYTLYEPKPDWRSEDGMSRHNSLGFRGAEITMPKPEGCFRIVCMGESSTYCTGIDNDEDTYPSRLGEHLKALGAGHIDIVNAGVEGYTSIENILRLLFHVVPLRPDLIIYYYTHNDVHPRRLRGLSRDYKEYSCSWFEPPDGGIFAWVRRRQNLATGYVGNIVRRRGQGRRNSLHIASNPPDAFRTNIGSLLVLAKASGASVLLVNPNYKPENMGEPSADAVWEHRRIVEELSERAGVPLVDLIGLLDYRSENGTALAGNYQDEVHFSKKGADAAARIVAEAVVENGLLRTSLERLRLLS